MKIQRSFVSVVILAIIMLSSTAAFGAMKGDLDNSGKIELQDAVLGLQVTAGLRNATDLSYTGNIGLPEVIYVLRILAGLSEASTTWYKDADGDKYSDSTQIVAVERPSGVYYKESELLAISGDPNDNDPQAVPVGAITEIARIQTSIQTTGAGWVAETNPVSVLSNDQRKLRLGAILPASIPQSAKRTYTARDNPPYFDWRNNNGNFVTPVKDQGGCGSCWAFSAVAALESQVLMRTGQSKDLSEQIVLSCSGAGSCNGGYPTSASDFLRNTGTNTESCYPYTATNGNCSNACSNWQSSASKIDSWIYVNNTVANIKNAIYTNGPLVTTMAVYTDFFSYRSGVYRYTWGQLEGYHAIVVVGWDDSSSAFIVKNSWNTWWGDSGYYRIAYSELTGNSQFGYLTIAYTTNPSCTYTINPTNNSFASSGGTGSVSVTSGCAWTAASNAPSWITITSGSSGNGNGSVNYSVAQNTGGPRTGTLTIAGQTFTVTQSGAIVNFPDKNLESAVRQAISKPSGDIFVSDLSGLTSLYANGKNIVNIEGLQYCTNLSELALESNRISDIGALAGLTNLTKLYLIENQISNISALAGLTKLTLLTLWGNQISSISALAGLTNLTDLYLDNNQISNISALSGLTNLSLLILASNQISDISALSGLTKLDILWLWSNQIIDITPLVSNSGINSGDDVDLTDNPLNATSCTLYIPQLQSRGATVKYNCSCTYSINPASNSVASTSSTGSISVTSPIGCNWTATSNATWITITSGNSGTGNGTVNYSVAANTGGSRTGIISVAGQTFTVTQIHSPSYLQVPDEYSTIQAAIDAASDGQTVLVADGTYKGSGNKDLDFKSKKITLRSANGPAATIIDCENNGRGFYFHSGETSASVVSGFTITNGTIVRDYGGGIRCEDSSPTISNCMITNCQIISDLSSYYAQYVGGGGVSARNSNITITDSSIVNCSINGVFPNSGAGLYFQNVNSTTPPTPTLINCLISNNKAGNARAGGIYSYGCSLTINKCNITDNSAWYGGGIEIDGSYYAKAVTITDTNILRNTAKAGGGIDCNGQGNFNLTIERCNISENIATRDAGGGIQFAFSGFSGTSMTLKNCIVMKNTAITGGGGIESWCPDGSAISTMTQIFQSLFATELII